MSIAGLSARTLGTEQPGTSDVAALSCSEVMPASSLCWAFSFLGAAVTHHSLDGLGTQDTRVHDPSCPVRLFGTPWTIARQAPLSMGFSRQEYWSRFPSPPPGDLPDPEIKFTSLVSPVLTGIFFTTVPPGKPRNLAK